MGLAACPVGVGMGEVRFFMALLILSVADFYEMPDNRESWESWESMGRKTPKDDGEVFTQKIDQKKTSSGLEGFLQNLPPHFFFLDSFIYQQYIPQLNPTIVQKPCLYGCFRK